MALTAAARNTCLSCGAAPLHDLLSLGKLPLANAYPLLAAAHDEPRFPLDLAFCGMCSLVQLRHIVPPHEMFSDYLYFSSYSSSMLRHAEALAENVATARGLHGGSLVMEVASNDGYLLQYFRRRGIPVLGIEPAANVARVAEAERHVPTLNAFFSTAVADDLVQRGQGADVLLGLNVLAHVPGLNDFIAGVRQVLKPEGVAIFEVPYVRDMVEKTEFDTIYHEHLCYFSAQAVAHLVTRHGLSLQRVQHVPVHGGSLRLTVGHGDAHSAEAQGWIESEHAAGLHDLSYYARFGENVAQIRRDLVAQVSALRAAGQCIAAYGAAAKGTILLNYCGLDAQQIAFVADRSPHKQGRRVPGCGIPIVPAEELTARQPDVALLLVWNLREEILAQEAAFRAQGGRFLVPIPQPHLV